MADILAPDAGGITRAGTIILSGGVVAYPTETVYGLGVDPRNDSALERLFNVKGRDSAKAVIILVRGLDDASVLVAGIPPAARVLADTYWPGPVTLVLPAAETLSPLLLGGGRTVALRHSSAPHSDALITAVGHPITSTSANLSGTPPARAAEEVLRGLGDRVDAVLDGGPSPSDLPSTVVDVTGALPRILREGPVTRQQVDAALGT